LIKVSQDASNSSGKLINITELKEIWNHVSSGEPHREGGITHRLPLWRKGGSL